MSKDISGQIVDKIKKEKISLRPRVFDYRSFLFWIIFAFLIILGGMSFSLILISIFSFGRENFQYASGGFWKIFLMSIPYLWVIFFGTFAYFGLRVFRSTKRGYRQNFSLILLIIFLASFSFGSLLHIFGFSRRMHQSMVDRVPFYQNITPTMEGQWARPDMGMLGGQIIKTGKDFIVVQNFRSKKITVIYSKESIIGEDVKLEKGEKVRVVGKRVDEETFEAKIIQSWENDRSLSPQDKEKIMNLRKKNIR
ncbi:MAG: hypothetical protein KAT32_02795 [Candidatus Moranbacteria bacterium]|nr:hypothetical protein [Candidatus Moranbacteria bacterium]